MGRKSGTKCGRGSRDGEYPLIWFCVGDAIYPGMQQYDSSIISAAGPGWNAVVCLVVGGGVLVVVFPRRFKMLLRNVLLGCDA